jgi:hypothetical protein
MHRDVLYKIEREWSSVFGEPHMREPSPCTTGTRAKLPCKYIIYLHITQRRRYCGEGQREPTRNRESGYSVRAEAFSAAINPPLASAGVSRQEELRPG